MVTFFILLNFLMLQIEIKHSLLIDIRIFLQTLRNKKWLDKNGYFYYFLDAGMFKDFDHEKISQEVENELLRYDDNLNVFINANKKYQIFLTRFGTYGSYEMPNIVFVNVHRSPVEIAETIIHEIIHLEVEPEVLRKNMSHAEKEQMVDCMVEKVMKI